MATTLTTGRKYSDADLAFVGWNASDCEGLHSFDYFRNWRYLGPDADGTEPLFEADNPLPTAELVVTTTVSAVGDNFESPEAAADAFAQYVEKELPDFFPDVDLTVTVHVRDVCGSEIWSDSDAVNGDMRFEADHIAADLQDLWNSWIRTPAAMTV